jgi:PEGA domain
MSASASDLSSSSISSSGHIDGLGRRSLSFDRETGEMLERVHLQPELAALESLIRDRVTRLSTFDERFAQPVRVERDPATGELTVLSEFITGSRLSDLLEATADAAIVPGVDVALGYLLDSLPALTLLHSIAGIAHGLIDASRTVLTPDGQVVFLDPVYGSSVERLNLSRQRLWKRFGIASPAGDGPVHLDAAADIAQVSLGAVALVLGRNLRPDEYPEALPSLLMEVIEVAQIRGSAAFATGLQRFLQRTLPIPGRRPYATADEAIGDVRQLVRRDIGVDVCRQAVVDFAAQMDDAFAAPDDDRAGAHDAEQPARRSAPSNSPRVPELDDFLDSFDHSDQPASAPPTPRNKAAADVSEDQSNETELSLDNLDSDSPAAAARDTEEVYELPPLDEDMAEANMLSRRTPPPAPVYREPYPIPASEEAAPAVTDEFSIEPSTDYDVEEIVEPVVPAEPTVPGAVESEYEQEPGHESAAAHDPAESAPPTPLFHDATAVEPASEAEPEVEPEKDSASSRRRKRQQQKSARARKDKLRSTTTGQKAPPPPPVPEPPRPTSPTGWLVAPQRAAQFEPPVPVPQPVPQQPPMRPAPVPMPAMPSFVPTPVGAMPQPVYPSSVAPSAYGTPSAPQPAAPGPLAPKPKPIHPAPQPSVQVRLKADTPASFASKRSAHTEPAPAYVPERFATLGLGRSDSTVADEPRAFPWKLALIAVGVAIVAIFVGRSYLPGRTAVPGEPGAQVDSAVTTTPPSTPPAVAADDSAIPAGRGRLIITTQPPGLRVLLDRKPVGETPLRLDVQPGRRMLTFLTSGGEVIRSVRVAAGKTETLDIPVFSGWIAAFAPIVLSVAADGKSIGSTEESRLMLPPGKHQLTFSNKELGYTSNQTVEIEPGEVKTINIEPRGTVNLNAIPWAEVWLDGQKLGDTPLAGTSVPLGLRDFVFKNPQFGEKKVSATIKASANPPVVVDFSK